MNTSTVSTCSYHIKIKRETKRAKWKEKLDSNQEVSINEACLADKIQAQLSKAIFWHPFV